MTEDRYIPDRLLHLIGQLGRGGAEKQLFCLAAALHRQGWKQDVVSFLPGGVWAERLREAGIPVYAIPRHWVKPLRLWRLWRLVRRLRPRVLLSWSEHVAVYAQWLRGVGTVRRVFNMRADISVDYHNGQLKAGLGRSGRALEQADFLVSNSRCNLETAAQAGLLLPPSKVIYNIVRAQGPLGLPIPSSRRTSSRPDRSFPERRSTCS